MYREDPSQRDRPRKAFLVGAVLAGEPPSLVEEHMDELEHLATSAGVEVAGRAVQRRTAPDPGLFIGRGKARQVGTAAQDLGADVLLFDDDLSPSQVKNLEELVNVQVMDRSGLILEIFHQRARTREARTQVELAQLNYLLPRLTRRWSHLSRQAGGIGVRGGEGETQLEADRRMLRKRIQSLEKNLVKIERTRKVQRRGRGGLPTVALAGYTNAGKSTLFNRLVAADARAEDRLFATLDSKLRRGVVDEDRPDAPVIFADTVGFIRKLPHHLVSSFRSTLGEIVDADLVLHVVDRSHPGWEEQMEVADEVLDDLGVDPERVIKVYNKADLLAGDGDGDGPPPAASAGGDGLWISAVTGQGLDRLKELLAARLAELGGALSELPPWAPENWMSAEELSQWHDGEWRPEEGAGAAGDGAGDGGRDGGRDEGMEGADPEEAEEAAQEAAAGDGGSRQAGSGEGGPA